MPGPANSKKDDTLTLQPASRESLTLLATAMLLVRAKQYAKYQWLGHTRSSFEAMLLPLSHAFQALSTSDRR